MDKIKFGWDYYLDPVDINAETSYFFVFSFPHDKYPDPTKIQYPFILTYQDSTLPIKNLLQDYIKKKPKLKEYQKKPIFALSNGYTPNLCAPIASLSKLVRTTQLNGLVLFIHKIKSSNQVDSQDQEDEIQDECALQQYFNINCEVNSQFILNINFQLPSPQEYAITIKISDKENINSLIKAFLAQVQLIFGLTIKRQDLQQLTVKLPSGEKSKDLLSDREKQIRSISYLINWSTITVNLKKSTNYQFKRQVKNQNHKIIIYKENSQEFIKALYQEVEFMSFRSLYKSKLRSKNKLASDKDFVCLKVMDTLIQEDETLSKISPFYRNAGDRQILNVVGRVVTQKMYFYKAIKSIDSKIEMGFNIQDYVYPVGNSTEKRDDFRQRLREKIKKMAEVSKVEHFRKMSNVEPIYIYTCQQVHHPDQRTDSTSPVYKLVNETLREEEIFKKKEQDFSKDWKYCFTGSLIKQLQLITPCKTSKVYRGVNYDPKLTTGGITTFKSFTSTSTEQSQACAFLKGDNATLFEMQIIMGSGKSIKEFSQFATESEVLLKPYVQFRVVEIKDMPQGCTMKRRIKLVQLSQSESSAEFPESIANFIIWIDDKQSFQGQYIYKDINIVQNPTILIHLNSNAQLVNWLNQQRVQKIIQDPTANFTLISNMTRQGNGLAGIEAIIEIQKRPFIKKVPIFLYIGDTKLAHEKVEQNKSKIKDYKSIQISNNPEQVQRFLLRVINNNSMALKKAKSNPSNEPQTILKNIKSQSVMNKPLPKSSSGKAQSSVCLIM